MSNDEQPIASRFYFASKTIESNIFQKFNSDKIWLKDIKHYIDKENLKTILGVNTMVGIKSVLVRDDMEGNESYILSYNKSYKSTWGNRPIYGNIVVVLSEKVFNTIEDDRKVYNSDDVEL
jgi:hypothetical protein